LGRFSGPNSLRINGILHNTSEKTGIRWYFFKYWLQFNGFGPIISQVNIVEKVKKAAPAE
jgi:hypothetical protein